ncbi:MAG: MFS transporter [Candidatus Lokiarchaeota archaeon]
MSKSKYRIYPLLLLGFFRVANIGMINLTIPIFFFQLGYSPGLIGIISASLNFVYIFSPLLFKNLPERIGNKASLVICLGAITFFQLFYQFTNNPYIFILLRLLEGLMLGLFWPVLNSSLSILTSLEKNKEGSKQNDLMGNKLIRKYSLSWNLGSVASFLIGSFLLFFVANINLMFHISFIYIVICLILALLFQEPKKNDYSNQEISLPTHSNVEIKKPKYIYYSIFLPLFIILMYGFLEHSNGLIYPLKYEILKIPLFINYLSSFILITTQTIFTYTGMSISLGKLKLFRKFNQFKFFLRNFYRRVNF